MNSKVREKNQVIALRKNGLTYREILQQIPVSKSSISLWLKHSPLTDREKEILKTRKHNDMSRWKLRAAASLRAKKEIRNKELFEISKQEFSIYIKDPFFQVGIALYWAEGSKRSPSFGFINSDANMIKLMIRWITEYLVSDPNEIKMRVYTHKAFSSENHEKFWSIQSGIGLESFGTTIYKTHQGLVIKKRPNYKGCVRIELGKVAYLRKLSYWQQMLIEHYKKERYGEHTRP